MRQPPLGDQVSTTVEQHFCRVQVVAGVFLSSGRCTADYRIVQ